MRKYYVKFDVDNTRLGFALAKSRQRCAPLPAVSSFRQCAASACPCVAPTPAHPFHRASAAARAAANDHPQPSRAPSAPGAVYVPCYAPPFCHRHLRSGPSVIARPARPAIARAGRRATALLCTGINGIDSFTIPTPSTAPARCPPAAAGTPATPRAFADAAAGAGQGVGQAVPACHHYSSAKMEQDTEHPKDTKGVGVALLLNTQG
eukprot:gene57555-biopygen5780